MTEYQEVKKICKMSTREIQNRKHISIPGKWDARQYMIWDDYPDLWLKAEIKAKEKLHIDVSYFGEDGDEELSKTICEYALELADRQ